jgi:hypothetical protein
VGSENIAPKSVARELLERFTSFHEYVREYGLQRSEGVLLRYLSEAYRTLGQSVPARFRTPEVEELGYTLASLVRGVDASLLEEWEALHDPAAAAARAAAPAADEPVGPRPVDLTADPRAFTARVRTELHRVLGALARKDYEEALEATRLAAPESAAAGWTPERLAAAMAAFYQDHSAIVTTPAARAPRSTVVRVAGERVWEVEQRIIDPEGHDDWAVYARVDLSEGVPLEGPIVELVRVGL